jgi:energy-coupling factor transporter ATP-binding protein EcfA2
VDEYLETVSLNNRTETLIKHLSGGQVKRASLANEIISQPNLLFVDEATSGLDEHTDGEIMKIFRQIAEGGKTVVCITHNLNNVEKYCHNVIILANGGYLVFSGSVEDAKTYFNVDRLGDVYGRLLDKPGTEWKDDFSRTPAYREMDAQVQLQTGHLTNDVAKRKPQSLAQKTGVFLRQLPLLSRRGWEIQLSDMRSMAVVGLQCVFVALLMCIGFGELPDELPARALKARQIIFLLTLSSFWFGCNNAAKDIVKEKDIYERERDVCLNVGSYYTAKFLMLATITTLQVLFLLLAVNWRTNLPGAFAAQAFSIGLIGICGVSTGLFISAISKNTDMAVTLIPVAIIPQVILAGVIFPIEGGFTEVLSSVFISCYWGQGNMMSTLPVQLTTGSSFEPWTYLSVGLVAFHTLLLIIMANVALYAADKRLSLQGTAIDLWLKKQG